MEQEPHSEVWTYVGLHCTETEATFRVGDVALVRGVASSFRSALQAIPVADVATYRKWLSKFSTEFSLTERFFPFSYLRVGSLAPGAKLVLPSAERESRGVAFWVLRGSCRVSSHVVAADTVVLADARGTFELEAAAEEPVVLITASNTTCASKALGGTLAGKRMLNEALKARNTFARSVGDPELTYRKRNE